MQAIRRFTFPTALALLVMAMFVPRASAADCTQTSVGFTPINDLGAGLYLGQFQGGLYPQGSNQVPEAHATVGLQRALAVRPLDPAGRPSVEGKLVLLSIGMSNTTQEFCSGTGTSCAPWSFMGQAASQPQVNHTTLRMANGAAGGQTAATWDSPSDPNYDRVRDQVLLPQGLSEAQVQAVWVKVADAGPNQSLPAPGADAYTLVTHQGNIARAIRVRYPNVQVVFFSSRIYAGYASTMLNPEPYAYESALAVKWLIEAQITQMAGGPIDPRAGDMNYHTVAPWIAWGPYLWADGLIPRSDGLIWECANLQTDGTHPSQTGQHKVATMLLQHMMTSPFARPWFRAGGGPASADLTGDGLVNGLDLAQLLGQWTGSATYAPCPPPKIADVNGDCRVNGQDLALLLGAWTN